MHILEWTYYFPQICAYMKPTGWWLLRLLVAAPYSTGWTIQVTPPSDALFESTANSFNWHSHGTVLPFVLSPPHAPILPSTATVLVLHPYFILKLLEVLIILFLQGCRIQQIIICGGAQISISLLYVLVVNNFLPASPEQRTRRRPAMQECVPAKSLYFFSILTVPVSIFLQFTEACFATPLD